MAEQKKPQEANMVETASMLFLAAVVVGVIFPAFGQVNRNIEDKANLEACRANLVKIHEALDKFALQSGGPYPKDLNQLVTKKILEAIPECPAASPDRVPYDDRGYKAKMTAPYRYTVFCYGNFHGDVGMGLNEPYYDSLYGMKPSAKSESP